MVDGQNWGTFEGSHAGFTGKVSRFVELRLQSGVAII